MAKFEFKSDLSFLKTPSSPWSSSVELIQSIATRYDDTGSTAIGAYAAEVPSGTSAAVNYDLSGLAGGFAEDVQLAGIRLLYWAVVKTAATVSGSYRVQCADAGLDTTAITISSHASIAIGEVIDFGIRGPVAQTLSTDAGNDITITTASQVGFKVVLVVIGNLAD